MPIKDMPAFVFSHKNIRNAVFFSLAACICLIIQLIFMKRSALNVVFDIIIPFTAAITFGCYAITMALDRPVILICPPTVYFVSLLINQLISVEVGVENTYPFIVFIELVPYILFSVCVATGKLKITTKYTLIIACVILVVASIVLAVLTRFFNLRILSTGNRYILDIIAMISSFSAVIFTYFTMLELLKIAGSEKKTRKQAK